MKQQTKAARLALGLRRAWNYLVTLIIGLRPSAVKSHIHLRTERLLVVCEVCSRPIRWNEHWYRDDQCCFFCAKHHPARASS